MKNVSQAATKKTTYNTQRNLSITFMKNVSLILITLGFVLVALIGCKKNYTIYERHDITACGVKDPLVNVKWLAEKCEEIKKGKAKEVTISLLKDTVTQDNAFMIRYHYKQRGKDMYSGNGYNCSGEEQYKFWSGGVPPPPNEERKFFKNKIDLGVIFKFSFK